MINIKYCRRCKEPFDLGTNFDVCPKCREELKEEKEYKEVEDNGKI